MADLRIFERTSSKRHADVVDYDLEEKRDKLNTPIKQARKRLKLQASFSSEFWHDCTNIVKQLQARNEVHRKISLRDFQQSREGDEKAWLQTPKARELMEEMKTQILEEQLCENQAKRLQMAPHDGPMLLGRVFTKYHTTSKLGLNNLATGGGKQSSSDQSRFRAGLLKLSDPRRGLCWCPITAVYLAESYCKAAHIFASSHGQDTMDAIFGKTKNPELFSPLNGILMSGEAEKRFDKGSLVLVPDVRENPSVADIETWNRSKIKEFKIRICDPEAPDMEEFVSQVTRWKDLDGKRVEFKNDFRPRSRYLYFHYCCAILRRSWTRQLSSTSLGDQLGKLYWGTPGKFMRKNMLLAFVEEMGHDYEALLEGAYEEEDGTSEEPKETALAAANHQIQMSLLRSAKERGGDEETDSDSDEEEEGEEEGKEEREEEREAL